MSDIDNWEITGFSQTIDQRYHGVPYSVYQRALSNLSPRQRQTLAWLRTKSIQVPEGHTIEYTINPPEKEPSEGYLRELKRDLRKAIQQALEEPGDKKTEYDTRFAKAREQSFDLNALLHKLDSAHKFIFCLSFGFFSSDDDLTADFCNGSKKLFNRYIREIEDAITEVIKESEKRDEGLDEILHYLGFSNAWDVQEETGTQRLNADPLQISDSPFLHEVTLNAYHGSG